MAVKLLVIYPRPKDIQAFEAVLTAIMCQWQ